MTEEPKGVQSLLQPTLPKVEGVDEPLALARSLEITSDEGLVAAGEQLKTIKGLQKQVEDTFAKPKEAAWAAHKAIVAAEKKHLDPLRAAEDLLKNKRGSFLQKRQEEAEAARRAEEERLRKEEEAKREAERKRLWAEGQRKAAQEVKNRPILIEPVAPPPPPPKVEGVTERQGWSFEIIDPKRINPEYLMPDEKKIRKTVNELGDQAAHVLGAGVKIKPTIVTSVKA